jgi:hypothetical protein
MSTHLGGFFNYDFTQIQKNTLPFLLTWKSTN